MGLLAYALKITLDISKASPFLSSPAWRYAAREHLTKNLGCLFPPPTFIFCDENTESPEELEEIP